MNEVSVHISHHQDEAYYCGHKIQPRPEIEGLDRIKKDRPRYSNKNDREMYHIQLTLPKVLDTEPKTYRKQQAK